MWEGDSFAVYTDDVLQLPHPNHVCADAPITAWLVFGVFPLKNTFLDRLMADNVEFRRGEVDTRGRNHVHGIIDDLGIPAHTPFGVFKGPDRPTAPLPGPTFLLAISRSKQWNLLRHPGQVMVIWPKLDELPPAQQYRAYHWPQWAFSIESWVFLWRSTEHLLDAGHSTRFLAGVSPVWILVPYALQRALLSFEVLLVVRPCHLTGRWIFEFRVWSDRRDITWTDVLRHNNSRAYDAQHGRETEPLGREPDLSQEADEVITFKPSQELLNHLIQEEIEGLLPPNERSESIASIWRPWHTSPLRTFPRLQPGDTISAEQVDLLEAWKVHLVQDATTARANLRPQMMLSGELYQATRQEAEEVQALRTEQHALRLALATSESAAEPALNHTAAAFARLLHSERQEAEQAVQANARAAAAHQEMAVRDGIAIELAEASQREAQAAQELASSEAAQAQAWRLPGSRCGRFRPGHCGCRGGRTRPTGALLRRQ